MEKDLLTEPWNTLESKPLFNNVEDTTVFTTWEENYQDLSGWCMDTFQTRCIFPVGESKTMKNSGMKIEETDTLVKKRGDVNLGANFEKEFITVAEKVPENYEQFIKPDDTKLIGGAIDVPEMWLDIPQSSIALQTDEWIQLVDKNEIDDPLESVSKVEKIDTEYEQQDNWDVIKTLDNNDSDNFDLLSYLCDDNTQSPAKISTDSREPSQVSTSFKASEKKPLIAMRLRGRKVKNAQSETIISSAMTSSVQLKTEEVEIEFEEPSLSRSPIKSPKTVSSKMKKEIKISNRGRKRSYESDSDESDCSYNESRKKNNAASRKSRMNKKAKETEMMSNAVALENNNKMLKIKVAELEKIVIRLRAAILESALKRRF